MVHQLTCASAHLAAHSQTLMMVACVGEGLEDEVPGSVQANTDTIKPADMLLPQQQTGMCVPKVCQSS